MESLRTAPRNIAHMIGDELRGSIYEPAAPHHRECEAIASADLGTVIAEEVKAPTSTSLAVKNFTANVFLGIRNKWLKTLTWMSCPYIRLIAMSG